MIKKIVKWWYELDSWLTVWLMCLALALLWTLLIVILISMIN